MHDVFANKHAPRRPPNYLHHCVRFVIMIDTASVHLLMHCIGQLILLYLHVV